MRSTTSGQDQQSDGMHGIRVRRAWTAEVVAQDRPVRSAQEVADFSMRPHPVIDRPACLPRACGAAPASVLGILHHFPVEDGGHVLTLNQGQPIARQAFGHVWRSAARAAGIPAGTGLHALRHYYASLLIRHGESVKVVQARLGHASASETLDTYSHLWPDSDDQTREAIDSVLGSEIESLADSVRTNASP